MAPALNPSSIAGEAILPPDAVYEILLRLPAKTLCRLRAVCRSWRSLTTDPLFIKVHEAHNRQEPLLLLTDAGGDIHALDLAGNMVKRVCSTNKTLAAGPREHLRPICLVRTRTGVRVLDAAAGTVTAAESFYYTTAWSRRRSGYEAYYALGRAAATGEHKVLRILRPTMGSRLEHRCDVFTLDGGGRRQWRPRADPPVGVLPSSTVHDVVIGGIAYFLSDYLAPTANAHEPDCIWSFDLETEEWAPAALRGPLSSHGLLHSTDYYYNDDYYSDDEYDMNRYIDLRCELELAQVSGWLVTIRKHWRDDSSVDLWFLRDMDKGLWVKEYSIHMLLPKEVGEVYPRPLLVLDDGRVVLSVTESRCDVGRLHRRSLPAAVTVRIYDPRTDACTVVAHMEDSHVVGVYKGGSLLHLRNQYLGCMGTVQDYRSGV